MSRVLYSAAILEPKLAVFGVEVTDSEIITFNFATLSAVDQEVFLGKERGSV